MNIGVFLAIGESFADFKKKGQDQLLINLNFKNYSKNFNKVYVFSYANEKLLFFHNVTVLPNRYKIPRYIYSLLLPLFYPREIKSCDIFRGLQLTGALPAILTKLLFGKKIVINYGYNYEKVAKIEGKFVQALAYRLIKNFLLLFADRIIVTSDEINSLFKNVHKKVYIPNGVDINLFKPLKVKKKYDVLFVGRLENQKNLFTLIKAALLLKKKVKVLFIGYGSLEKELIKAANNSLVDLNIIHKIPHNRLPLYYNQAKMFILPSVIEGNPKVLLEAMSCGLPCIGNKVSGTKEIINDGHNGLLFLNSSYSLAKKLSLLINNRGLARALSKNARKSIEKNYNYELLAEKEIKVLKNE